MRISDWSSDVCSSDLGQYHKSSLSGGVVAGLAAHAQIALGRHERGRALKIVNGASLQPRSGGAPKKLVLLLHGFGSSGTDMISLAPQWQEALPDTLFLAPHAPQQIGRAHV